MCRKLAKQHGDEPDVPAEWVQIALILYRVELEKSLRETEDHLNEMPGVLAVFDLDEAPHYTSFCRWEQKYRMRELHRLLPFSGRIRERHRRRHRNNGARYHSFDSSATAVSDSYCIF
jgi:IS5 family transposase